MNKKLKLGGVTAIAIAVFAGGIGVGSAMADPTKSEEYAAVAADRDGKQGQVSKLEDQVDDLESRRAGLQKTLDTTRTQYESQEAKIKEREALVQAAETAVKKREDAVKGAEAQKAATTISEGSWTVGRNVEPGTYTTSAPVTGRCYWGIYVSGTNGDDIVANDNVDGGQPTVTLQEGQDFKTSRCGSWSKIG